MQQTPSFVSVRSGLARYAGFAIVATLALVLVGCGSDDDGQAADDASASADTAATDGFANCTLDREMRLAISKYFLKN